MARIEDYKDIARAMLENEENRQRQDRRRQYLNMYNSVWNLPTSLADLAWIQKRVIKHPFDAVEAGKRAYATMEPSFNIVRPGMNEQTLKDYNERENVLRWQYMMASKRRQPVTAEILDHAILYGEAVVQPMHIDAQLKLIGDMPAAKKRSIKQFGDFMLNVHSPLDVRVRYTDMGVDGVLAIKVQTLAEFESFWGEKAASVIKKSQNEKSKDKRFVVSYDYMDYTNRAVWAKLQDTNTSIDSDVDGLKIMLEEHGLPFLPWAAAHTPNREGLLYSLVQTGAWDRACEAETLLHSESISYAAAPRFAIEGPTGEVEIHYGEPGRQLHVPPGHKLVPISPPQIDSNLMQLSERVRADMQLVPDIVISGNTPAGAAGFTVNQLMQSGLQTYAPYREVAERVIEQVGCLMMDWSKFLKKPMSAPKRGERGIRSGEHTVDPDTYDYGQSILVELKPDMPVDRMSQIQAASQGVQILGWSRAYANEQLGENDPEKLDKQSAMQALKDAKLGDAIMQIQAEGQLEAQARTMGLQALIGLAQDPNGAQMLQQLQQQLAAQAAMPAGQSAPGQGNPADPSAAPGLEGVSSNPAMGEVPPAMMVPGTGSQPIATGQDQSGTQL